MNDPIRARPIARSEVYRFGHEVESRLLKESGEYRLFYQTKLSTFLNPKGFSEDTYSKKIYRETIGLAICYIDRSSTRPRKHVIAVCDVVSDWSKLKEDIFLSANIYYFILRPEEYAPSVEHITEKVLTADLGQSKVWRKINTQLTNAEDRGYVHLQKALSGKDVAFFTEVSLEDALYLAEHERNLIKKRAVLFNKSATKKISERLDMTLNFDGTVATRPPYAFPLLFIEYDGSIHRAGEPTTDWTAEQKAQHEKDQIKNEICKKSQVPLIRVHDVNPENTWRANEFISVISERITQDLIETDGFFGSLLGAIEAEIDALRDKYKTDDIKVLVSLLRQHRKLLIGNTHELKNALSDERNERDNDRKIYDGLLEHSPWSDSYLNDEAIEAEKYFVSLETALRENQESLFSVDIKVLENETGYTICASGVPIDAIVALPEIIPLSISIPIKVYAIPTIKDLILDELKEYGRNRLEQPLKNHISNLLHKNRTELGRRIREQISAIRDNDKANKLNDLTRWLILANSDDERLRRAKQHIANPKVVRIRTGESPDDALSRHKRIVFYTLNNVLTALSRIEGQDSSTRQIIELELKEYVDNGLANVKYEASRI